MTFFMCGFMKPVIQDTHIIGLCEAWIAVDGRNFEHLLRGNHGFFSSYVYLKVLLTLQLCAIRATVRIPNELTDKKPMISLFDFRKSATLLSYVPKHNKNVILISSLHDIDEDAEDSKKKTPRLSHISYISM
ncbi:hypothetical protein CDAR_604991 [Caerostris darwini]|uniref:Uncharacterized protein n=1 Tax=Caerostris darwini TaxID=1538125 RepID=A0AAV4X7L2_9ARAC|nr:hypothetical protein CDAR_604991 [Caerostris darwini]